MPGVVFADGEIGLTDSPGGKLFTSTAILTFAFAARFEFVSVVVPHAEIKEIEAARTIKKYLFIKK